MIPLDYLDLAPGGTRARRIHTDRRMHARPVQLHCGRGKPGLRLEVE